MIHMEVHMFVSNTEDIKSEEVGETGAVNAWKQSLVGPEQGWPGYEMRLFTLKNKGNSPRHVHQWPHINYVVRGKGVLYLEGKEYPLTEGAVAFVPGNTEHQYRSLSEEEFAFICIIPVTPSK